MQQQPTQQIKVTDLLMNIRDYVRDLEKTTAELQVKFARLQKIMKAIDKIAEANEFDVDDYSKEDGIDELIAHLEMTEAFFCSYANSKETVIEDDKKTT